LWLKKQKATNAQDAGRYLKLVAKDVKKLLKINCN
jgi:hypothetical protein